MLIENKSSEHDAVDSSNFMSNEEHHNHKLYEEVSVKGEEEIKSEVSTKRVVSRTPKHQIISRMLPPGHLSESMHTLLHMKSESDHTTKARLGKRTMLARSDDLNRNNNNDLSPSKLANKRVKRTNSSATEIPKYNDSDSNDVVEKTLQKSYSSFSICQQQIELPVLN